MFEPPLFSRSLPIEHWQHGRSGLFFGKAIRAYPEATRTFHPRPISARKPTRLRRAGLAGRKPLANVDTHPALRLAVVPEAGGLRAPGIGLFGGRRGAFLSPPARPCIGSGAELPHRGPAISGGMVEWFKAPVLKTGVGASPPWVRIPLPPPQLPLLASPSTTSQ